MRHLLQVENLNFISWFSIRCHDDGCAVSENELRDGGTGYAGNITGSLSPGLAIFQHVTGINPVRDWACSDMELSSHKSLWMHSWNRR